MQKGFCAVQIIVAAQRGAAHESASQYMKSSSSPFLCRRGSGLLIYSSMLTSELLRLIYAPLAKCFVFAVVSLIVLRGKVKLVGVWWVIGVDASFIITTFVLSDMLAE